MPMSIPATPDFLRRLGRVLGTPAEPVGLHEPEFAGNEWAYVKECLDTGWVSSAGRFVNEFEVRLAAFTGARHAVAVVNGTAGLHAALLAAGVMPGDEVIVPALTFVATANAVVHCGAIPHFADADFARLGMDPEALADHLARIAEPVATGFRNRSSGRRLAAVVPMHTFGHPVDMERLLRVLEPYRLPVVEDAAESLGSWIGDRHTGRFGRAGVISFNGNKVVTTGGGGAIITDDDSLARSLRHLTTTAKLPHRWEFVHDQVAYNYRMPNLNAALGCAQLERLPDMLRRKRLLADAYAGVFAAGEDFRFVVEPAGCTSNYWLNAIRLAPPLAAGRDELLDAAHAAGYQLRPVWQLMHRLPMYAECPRAPLPVAEALASTLLNLPSSPRLAEVAPC